MLQVFSLLNLSFHILVLIFGDAIACVPHALGHLILHRVRKIYSILRLLHVRNIWKLVLYRRFDVLLLTERVLVLRGLNQRFSGDIIQVKLIFLRNERFFPLEVHLLGH